ncbi:TPA: MarC family protein [Methanosarcinaceae archaeon]|nr:MarC family protein [Methanosarcinaceae archaeon]
MDSISFFIYSLMSVFVVVSPLSAVVTFISLTSKMTFEEKNDVANKAIVLGCTITIFFAITGNVILEVFSIDVDSLRVAGGILLFTIAFDMMHAKVSAESITEEEISQSQEREDIWVFPIALPLLTGPGTISAVIVLMGSTSGYTEKLMILVSIVLTFAITLVIFHFSRRIHKLVGYNGMLVFTRLMGLFLAALAVDLFSTGALNIVRII